MGSIERQEERWTVEKWGDSASTISYRVTNKDGDFVAYVDVPPGDEGRSTVAKMVAALQMEGALEKGRSALDRLMGDTDPNDPEDPSLVACQAMSAALEAAKRLQP